MPQYALTAADGPSARSQSHAGAPTSAWSLKTLGRASATGALAFAAAQMVDMRLTGRPGSDTPVRGFEALSRRRVRGAAARAAVGYAVQSSLAPVGAAAAVFAGPRMTRQFGAAVLALLGVVGIANPALGLSTWPWRWTRSDWMRELTLKSVLAIAVIAAL
jgi:hypothetical protein